MDNYHTYFVASIQIKDDEIKIYNDAFATMSVGIDLAKDVMNFVEQEHPGAATLNIIKLD